jgi:S1-C subfamily serine protease
VDGRINRGNSGGPVVDIETGKVVGIVTAKYIPFLKSVEELQQFVRTNRMSTSGGSVQIMGVDFAAFFNAMFEMVDLLAEALQLIQVGIGYVIPLTVFSDYLR